MSAPALKQFGQNLKRLLSLMAVKSPRLLRIDTNQLHISYFVETGIVDKPMNRRIPTRARWLDDVHGLERELLHTSKIERDKSMSIPVQFENRSGKANDDVLIHLRHLASGEVLSIDYTPPQLTAGEWRRLLLVEASEYYQTFVGARGFFRLPRRVYDSLLAQVTPLAAE